MKCYQRRKKKIYACNYGDSVKLQECFTIFQHSHKKQKYSLETLAELAGLRIYVENQGIL